MEGGTNDLKHLAYVPFAKATTCEDGDCGVL
jgi:hypothetical protein